MYRRLKVGHTGITWFDNEAENAIKTIAKLGFHGAEIFGWGLNSKKQEGKLDLFEKYDLPFVSSYFTLDIMNPAKKEEALQKLDTWAKILVEKGGRYVTLGGDMFNRKGYDFNEHKSYIVSFVNEIGKILNDMGLVLGFHPHTGTPVETREEIESFMDSVDTTYVGFSPDVGQIQKGGSDPKDIVNKYLSIIKLVHLKDFCGKVEYDEDGREIDTSGYLAYCPLGEGVVDLPKILDIMENSDFDGYIMAELDRGPEMPISAEEAVQRNAEYLKKLNFKFVERNIE